MVLRPEGTPIAWVNWSPLFQALEILWLGLLDPKKEKLDPLLLSSEYRRLAIAIRPLLSEAGWGMYLRNETAYLVVDYGTVFVEDIMSILERLHHN